MPGPGRRILDFFRTGPDRPPFSTDAGRVRRRYERMRWSVFVSVTLGYGMFYVSRINFGAAKKPMLDEGVLDASQMGVIGSCLLIAYAAGKLVNGFLSDRANIRRFMATALLLSALTNLAIWAMSEETGAAGSTLSATSFFLLFAGAWALNGWFQSVGSAPSIVSLSHWFSQRERGSRYGIWCISHNIGEGITFLGTALLVAAAGWRWGFLGPALLCGGTAFLLYRTLADRPETYGLPPIADYKDDPVPQGTRLASTGRLQIEVLRNPAVWILGLSSALMYMARYAMNNWGQLFLEAGKGYAAEDAGIVLAVYAITGAIGSFTSGLISDAFFGARRNLLALLAGIAEIGALVALHLIPPSAPTILPDALAMAVFGYSMGILVAFLGGLMAIDIVPHRVAGAAAGVVGMFSYVGAAVQDATSGILIDGGRTVVDGAVTWSFAGPMAFWIGASVLSALLALLVWNPRHAGLSR
jgi:OPA family sugar phosphate sensor protein UhpC-like MFS transporter